MIQMTGGGQPVKLIKRMYRKLDNWSLQHKLVAAYVVIILLPIIGLSGYVFSGFYANYIADIKKNNAYMLDMETLNISNSIESMERTAQLALADRDVRNYLLSSRELDSRELVEFNMNSYSNLLRLQFNNPGIAHIRIYSGNPFMSEIWPVFFDEGRIAHKPWYPEVLEAQGRALWRLQRTEADLMQRYVSDSMEQEPKISLFRQIQLPADRHAGVTQVDMLLRNFFPKTYGDVGNDQSQMFIIDRFDQVFTHEEHTFLSSTGLTPTDVLAYFSLYRHTDNVKDSFEFTHGAIPLLGTYTYLEQLDLYMLNVMSLETFASDVSKQRNVIIVAAIILIIILSAATYYLNSFILKSLHILADSMKKARRGDFQFDIAVKSSGEVGELAHHFRKMLQTIIELIAEAVNKQAVMKEAELRTMRNQIDSHFLYNTLENIKMMAELEQQYAVSDALTSLGGMMRYNLRWNGDYVRLRDELYHIKNYLSLMNIRYDGKMTLLLDVPERFMEQEVLKMSLQPIVENAVKHGLPPEQGSDGGRMTVTIRARADEGLMLVSVTDDGVGMAQDKVRGIHRNIAMDDAEYAIKYGAMERGEREGSGIGLRNVHQRIQLNHGSGYGLTVDSEPQQYTRVTLVVPLSILPGEVMKHAQASHRR